MQGIPFFAPLWKTYNFFETTWKSFGAVDITLWITLCIVAITLGFPQGALWYYVYRKTTGCGLPRLPPGKGRCGEIAERLREKSAEKFSMF